MNIKTKKIFINFLILTVFSIYILLANNIFDNWIKFPYESKMESDKRFANLNHIEDVEGINYSIDSIKIVQKKWKKYIQVTGWLFLSGEDVNKTDRYITFESENNRTYIYSLYDLERSDILEIFKGKAENLNKSGFFSLIPINDLNDNGSYNIKLYCENRNNLCVVSTPNYITKMKSNLYLKSISMPVSDKSSIEKLNNEFNYNLEELEFNENERFSIKYDKTENYKTIDISGWAFIPSVDASKSKIMLVLKSNNDVKIFTSFPVIRPDVERVFNNKGICLKNSGFAAKIPYDSLREANYKIGIYVEDGNNKFFSYTDKEIKIKK